MSGVSVAVRHGGFKSCGQFHSYQRPLKVGMSEIRPGMVQPKATHAGWGASGPDCVAKWQCRLFIDRNCFWDMDLSRRIEFANCRAQLGKLARHGT